MIHNGKRVAYTRIPTRKLIYSVVEEEKGEMCGTMQTLYLKVIRLLQVIRLLHVHVQIPPDWPLCRSYITQILGSRITQIFIWYRMALRVVWEYTARVMMIFTELVRRGEYHHDIVQYILIQPEIKPSNIIIYIIWSWLYSEILTILVYTVYV